MESLHPIIEGLKQKMDALDKERERAYVTARELRRMSVQAVREIHKGHMDAVPEMLKQARDLAAQIVNMDRVFGFVEEAMQEYAEAALTYALLTNTAAPTVEDLKTTERGYLLGLADAIGELRRHALNLLRHSKIEEAAGCLDMMDEIFSLLMQFDHTDAIVPLRRKQDALRGIIERTRGDLTTIQCQKRLEEKLDKAQQ